MNIRAKLLRGIQLGLLITTVAPAQAQLPSAADPSRVDTTPELPVMPDYRAGQEPATPYATEVARPANASEIKFILREIRLEGVTAFKQEELADIYAEHIDKRVSLDTVWSIAESVTSRYHKEQYFLSRAYVPVQEIKDGMVTIRVAEGYIKEIECDKPSATYNKSSLIAHFNKELLALRPLKAGQLESYLLHLNDIPGISVVGVLQPSGVGVDEGAKLVLKRSDKKGKGSFTIDNYSSKYFGVHGASLSYQDSFIRSQQTFLSAATSIGGNEIKHGSIKHQIPFYPRWELALSAGYVNANPSASLSSDDIVSNSWDASIGIEYKPIRQWHKNLTLSAKIDGKNTNTDIIKDITMTRDRVRALRVGATYSTSDGKSSSDYLDVTVSQGLRILDSSKVGDKNMSRSEAKPDFKKLNLTYSRQQYLGHGLLLTGNLGGQLSSSELYSSEEYGYGGQTFGRAYDSSEITGDHGVSTSLELSYMGISLQQELAVTPYVFGDIGRVWNKDSDASHAKAASAGFGIRLNHTEALSGNLGVAWPLMRDIGEPIYGNGRSPRLLFQIKYGF